MPREKSRYRNRSLSDSSDSSYGKKRSKNKRRSRDRSGSSSHKKRRSSSRSRHRRRSYSRSSSPDKYESKSKRRSSSRSKKSSRDVSPSSSRSRSKISKKSKSRRRSRSSSERSSSYEIEKPVVQKRVNLDDTEEKLEKAIKAAAAAGLSMTKIPTYEYKEIEIKEDMPTIHDRNLLSELNSDSFVQKSFTSSKSKKQQNILIDLTTNTVKVPEAEVKEIGDDTVIDFSKIPCEEELREMWVQKLYLYRKKMLKDELQ